MQSAYFFRTEHEISKSTTLRAWHDEFSYWFALCFCPAGGRDGCSCKPEQLPACNCSLHMIASRTRVAALNCPKRRSKLLKLAKKLVGERQIFVIFGDFSLLGFLLCKLGAKQVFMVTDNPTKVSQRVFQEFIETNHCNQAKLCSISEVVEHLEHLVYKDPDLKTCIALVAEPFYQSSILPWDNTKFTSTLKDFFSLTGNFLNKSQVMVCPSSFEIRACCVQFDDLWKISRPVEKCMGFDMRIFDKLISGAKSMAVSSPEAQPLWEYPCKALSDPITILRWNSEQCFKPIKEKSHFQLDKLTKEALNGIAFWVEYTMFPGIEISTGPIESTQIGNYITWDRCERQGVHLYDVPHEGLKLPCLVEYDPASSEISFNFKDS